ncbi:c-type cytochrome [Tranquillimonas rosea]|uniref:c-type cytochrome n=1 Tax=Tranquillimonas rosea TaxID=641238 RepID=UPI003BA8DA8E
MPPILRWAVFLLLVLAGAFWFLTRPDTLDTARLDDLGAPDVAHGEQVFLAAGCASCHAAPEGDDGEDSVEDENPDEDAPPVLAGGQRFASGFGTFVAPNISPDPEHGIGDWSDAEIIQAVTKGVSPDGAHYYPAFPYTAYAKADLADIRDLVAYWRTLPESDTPSEPHELSFPFTLRRGIGLWKRAFVSDDWVVEGDLSEQAARGRYLAEALGHCGECHTPRNRAGALLTEAWLGGAANPSGDGRIPNITPGGLDWSESNIAAYLRSGFTPSYDVAGGEMTAVIDKLGQLPDAETAALAAYLKAVPPVAQTDG